MSNVVGRYCYAVFCSTLLLSCAALASIRDSILTNCDQAVKEAEHLSAEERSDTIKFIARLMVNGPDAATTIPLKIIPGSGPAFSEELQRSRAPLRESTSLRCGLRVLAQLTPEASDLLPELIRRAFDRGVTVELQRAFEKTSIDISDSLVTQKQTVSASTLRALVLLLRGETSSLAEIILAPFTSNAVPVAVTLFFTPDDSLRSAMREYLQRYDPECMLFPPLISKALDAADVSLRFDAVKLLTSCPILTEKSRGEVIKRIADSDPRVAINAGRYIANQIQKLTVSELVQAFSLPSPSVWQESMEGSFARFRVEVRSAIAPLFSSLGQELQERALPFLTKEDLPLIENSLKAEKIPAFMIKLFDRWIMLGGSIKLLQAAIKKSTTNAALSPIDQERLMLLFLAHQYDSRFLPTFWRSFEGSGAEDEVLLDRAGRKIVSALSAKDWQRGLSTKDPKRRSMFISFISGAATLDRQKQLLMVKELSRASASSERMVFVAMLKKYQKELMKTVATELKKKPSIGMFLLKAEWGEGVTGALARLLQESAELSCEESAVLIVGTPADRDRAPIMQAATGCMTAARKNETEALIALVEPLSVNEEKILISFLTLPSVVPSALFWKLPLSPALRKEVALSRLKDGAPETRRDLIRLFRGKEALSPELIAVLQEVYETDDDDAVRGEALAALTEQRQTKINIPEAVRALLRDDSQFIRGAAIFQSLSPEDAGVVIAGACKELSGDRLKQFLELLLERKDLPRGTLVALDELLATETDGGVRVRAAAVRVKLDPGSELSTKLFEEFSRSRFTRDFQTLSRRAENPLEQ